MQHVSEEAVTEATPTEDPVSREEFERRFKAHIVSTLCPVTLEEAKEMAQAEWNAVTYEEHSSGGYENDPEGAADESMSYWEGQ
jgi:hypothetical protein